MKPGSRGLFTAFATLVGTGTFLFGDAFLSLVPPDNPSLGVALSIVVGGGAVLALVGMLSLTRTLFSISSQEMADKFGARTEAIRVVDVPGLYRQGSDHVFFAWMATPPTLYIDAGMVEKLPVYREDEIWRAGVVLRILRRPRTARRWGSHGVFEVFTHTGLAFIWFWVENGRELRSKPDRPLASTAGAVK